MSQAAQLAGRIVVCHRERGFLRLELPAELCTPDVAADLGAGVRTLTGVLSAVGDHDEDDPGGPQAFGPLGDLGLEIQDAPPHRVIKRR